MKRIGLVILALSCITGCAHQDDWTRQDTVGQVAVWSAMAIDAYNTSQIQYRDGWEEQGPLARPILGSQPSTEGTILYFSTLAITNYLIARSLPSEWRPYWHTFTFIDHTYHATTHW